MSKNKKPHTTQGIQETDPGLVSYEAVRTDGVPYQVWDANDGSNNIDAEARAQMERAARLPVSLRGALMPDAHVGYGLPIGGVLATDNAVIPYAVGVDIACRMRLTIFDISPIALEQKRDKYRKALENNTIFGAGRVQHERIDHPAMHSPLWDEVPIAREYKDVAWGQLGTSGSGNHFVEFGALNVTQTFSTEAGVVEPGRYLALLSHSGSRRLGQEVANAYTAIAMHMHPELPKEFAQLAWLDLNTNPGREYWAGMTLAGLYAAANHEVIHNKIVHDTRLDVIGMVENHHNFAWKEQIEIDGETVEAVVHRKGATPAGKGVLGVIPGNMGANGYLVRGRGNASSMNSAAHGAGRRMSRAAALKSFDWEKIKRKLKDDHIEVLSAGLDEVPGAYKDIEAVMNAQRDLVETLASFRPMLVKMDGGGKGGRGGFIRGEALD